uniref:phosphatase n=1 Tax=Candidatus Nanopelagicus sp. TaxID=2518620 RepID=UPI00404A7824
MESLALLASVIISLTALGGPISLALTFLPQRLLPLAVIKILAFLIAVIAIFIGVFLMINVNSIGARVVGSFGVITASIAIYRIIRVIPKI